MRTRFTAITAIVLLPLVANSQASPPTPPAKGLVVCLAIGPKVYDWTKDIMSAKSVSELRKTAETHNCSVEVKDGKAFVVHEPSFAIEKLKRSIELVEELDRIGINAFEAIDPSKLSQNAYRFLLSKQANLPGFKDAYERSDVKLHLEPSVSATFTSGGKTVSLDWSPTEPPDKHDALTTTVPGPDAKKIRDLPTDDFDNLRSWTALDQITLHFSPKSMGVLEKAEMGTLILADIAQTVKRLRKELKERSSTFLARLMQPYQDGFWNGTLSDGATSGDFASLSPKAKEAFLNDISFNYRSYGFASADEASTFIQKASISSASFRPAICSRIGTMSFSSILNLK